MKAFMNWSGGKDSALSLYKAQQEGLPVEALVTSVNQVLNRISMHGVRSELLQQQSAALGLPLHTIAVPEMPGMQAYEAAVKAVHQKLTEDGFTHGVFGDIFLEDLRQYREALLHADGLQCLFPIWKLHSNDVIEQFLSLGFKAVVVCVNSQKLDRSFCGREMDASFFSDLPAGVDLCGENGEYHSFVYDGPNFSAPVSFTRGEMVFKEYAAPKSTDDCFAEPRPASGFYFCDLLPV